MDNNFGNILNSIRKERGLSMKQLATLAGISRPLVSNLINNRRVVGEFTARKLGVALELQGSALQEFIFSAINNCTDKILAASKGYPSEMLNLVAGKLNALGIKPSKLARCVYQNEDVDAALYLVDGKSAFINVEIVVR